MEKLNTTEQLVNCVERLKFDELEPNDIINITCVEEKPFIYTFLVGEVKEWPTGVWETKLPDGQTVGPFPINVYGSAKLITEEIEGFQIPKGSYLPNNKELVVGNYLIVGPPEGDIIKDRHIKNAPHQEICKIVIDKTLVTHELQLTAWDIST